MEIYDVLKYDKMDINQQNEFVLHRTSLLIDNTQRYRGSGHHSQNG